MPDDVTDDTPMLCRFEGIEGYVDIGAYTYLEHKTKMEADFATRKGPFWTGVHIDTKDKIRLNKKKDRAVMLALSDSKGQLLQVHLSVFNANDALALDPAIEFMTEIGQSYVEGHIKKLDLSSARHSRLEALFGKVPSRGAKDAAAATLKAAPSAKKAKSAKPESAKPPAKKAKLEPEPGPSASAPSTPPPRKAKKYPSMDLPPLSIGEMLGNIG